LANLELKTPNLFAVVAIDYLFRLFVGLSNF